MTLKSIAPAKIYEEGDLIKRSIRDLYNRDIDEVLVEGERGYRNAKDFMKMIMPSHAKNVKHYTDALPLFARYQVESYLSSMFNPVVQLKSGGYLVIGVTEALVSPPPGWRPGASSSGGGGGGRPSHPSATTLASRAVCESREAVNKRPNAPIRAQLSANAEP